MALGIHMIDINKEQRPPCTQFQIELDWETLIQSKDKPEPYLILRFGIIFAILLFVIAIKIRRQRNSIVMPLNQPRDLANIFLATFFMIVILIDYTIKNK